MLKNNFYNYIFSFSKNKNPGKNSLSKSQLAVLFPDSESLTKTKLLEFFDEVLGLNLKSNIDFTNTFRELIKEKSANGTYDDRGPFVDQMLKLSSHVFFNRYFSQNYINPGEYTGEKLKTEIVNKMLYAEAILKESADKEGKIFLNGKLNKGFDPYFREEPNNY